MKRLVWVAWLVWAGVMASVSLTALGKTEGSIQKTWEFPEGIQTLIVDADRQDLIVAEGGSRIVGRLIGETSDEARISQTGTEASVTVRSEPSWFSRRSRTARVELTVPQGIRLELSTASGAILVQVATASLVARSASGDVEAPRGGQAATLDSTSGTVRLRGFSGPVKASTVSGDLWLEQTAGVIQATTLSGTLRGRNLSPEGQSRFASVSGDIDLILGSDAGGYTIRAETVSGDLDIVETTGQRSLTVGTGSLLLTLKTVSGDIRLR